MHTHHTTKANIIPAEDALVKLKEGNVNYLALHKDIGNVSSNLRRHTANNIEHPFAVILTCCDSRVIPQSMFCTDLGNLFVIRVAGNVVDEHQIGTINYAISQLNARLVVVLGHTHCNILKSAITGNPDSYIPYVTDEIKKAIGDEKDENKACRLNTEYAVRKIKEDPHTKELIQKDHIKITNAVYDIELGKVIFYEDLDDEEDDEEI